MFRLTMAMCVFLMLQCGYLRAQSGGGQSEFCLKNYNRDCPAEPADCGTIPCTRPSPTWTVNPSNACEMIPSYDFSAACPANSKEPVSYVTAQYTICNPNSNISDGTKGQDDSVDSNFLCWKIRYCASSCTQTSQTDGTINTIANPSPPQGVTCVFMARSIQLFVNKCNSGVGNGEPTLEAEWKYVTQETCSGDLKPCSVPPAE